MCTTRGCKCLPLGVWERNGFIIEDLQTKPKPHSINGHDVLGVTCHAPLVSASTRGEYSAARQKQFNAHRLLNAGSGAVPSTDRMPQLGALAAR